ncbi:diaminopimelate decarboxylase [candidate division KSB1 bacterium]
MKYINSDLYWSKVKIRDIAETVGTPFYLYNYNVIKKKFKSVENAFKSVKHILCYALKANSNFSILKMIAGWGYGAEVVSGGELFFALRAGFNPEKIVFSGSGKTEEEIKSGIENNILLFNTESWDEILLINKTAKRSKKLQKILIRVNPDINPGTHPYITTGLKGEKFGIEWKKAEKIFEKTKSLPNIKIAGIHIHLGSQITKKEPFINCSDFIRKFIKTLESSGIELQYINIGGGLGIDYECDFNIFGKKARSKEKSIIAKHWADAFISNNIFNGKIFITEPGRFVMAEGGMIVTKVLYKKRSFNKNFYIVDAGMNDFIRPSLYNAHHNIVPLKKGVEKQLKADVVGPLCESSDFFAKNRNLPIFKKGDLLAILSTGAYGMSLSSNYNSRLKLPEIIIKNDKASVIRNRETKHDLLKNQPAEKIWLNLKRKTHPIKEIKFSKFSATGNDFIIIDNRKNIFKGINLKRLFSTICRRKTSIGADGVILISKRNEKCYITFYNPDGSVAECCGNGLRAVSVYLKRHKILGTEQSVETADGIHEIELGENNPKVRMNISKKSFKERILNIENKKIKGYIIHSGVPHFVIFAKDIEDPKLMDTGKKIRYDKEFRPNGTNVDFVRRENLRKISVRTYERGVEAETLSCGTGAAASAYISRKILNMKLPIKVITKGGILTVSEEKNKVFLSGEVKEIYSGVFDLQLFCKKKVP